MASSLPSSDYREEDAASHIGEPEASAVKKLWQEFLKFIMSGNVLMLAVAFILGVAIKAVVTSFTDNIMQPLIGAIVGKPEFTNTFKIGDGVIQYGAFITAVIDLLITGFVLFLIVKAYDAYRARRKGSGEEPEEPTEEIVLLREIRDALTRQA
jgi:large conductance mechanosensitive channel